MIQRDVTQNVYRFELGWRNLTYYFLIMGKCKFWRECQEDNVTKKMKI